MTTILDYYKYSLLATAAYVRTEGSNDAGDFVLAASNADDNRLPLSIAQYLFVQNSPYGNGDVFWKILHYYGSDATNDPVARKDKTGFGATLLQQGNEKVLAIRGTEPFEDDKVDLLQADMGAIGVLGVSLPQAVSMVNLIMRLQADTDDAKVPQLTIKTTLTRETERAVALSGTIKVVDELDEVRYEPVTVYIDFDITYTGMGLEKIDAGEKIRVTGHSLGGHLAVLAARLFPDFVDAEVVVFNSPGFDAETASGAFVPTSTVIDNLADGLGDGVANYIDPIAHKLTDELVGLFRNSLLPTAAEDFARLEITSLVSENLAPGDDASLVSSQITNQAALGDSILVATEANSHVIEPLTDSLALQALIATMNSILSLEDMRALLLASADADNISEERLTEGLFRLFLEDEKFLSARIVDQANPQNNGLPIYESENLIISDAIGPIDNLGWVQKGALDARDAFYDAVLRIEQAIQKGGGNYFLTSLAQDTATQLENLSRGNDAIGFRYALMMLNPFAVVGDHSLYNPHNENGELDLYDPQTGKGEITGQWIEDRAAMLTHVADSYNKCNS
jgi:hypothetical protein